MVTRGQSVMEKLHSKTKNNKNGIGGKKNKVQKWTKKNLEKNKKKQGVGRIDRAQSKQATKRILELTKKDTNKNTTVQHWTK